MVGSMLLVGYPATAKEQAIDYLKQMSSAATISYKSRQLVVYLDEPQSAAVMRVQSWQGRKFVRSESDGEVTQVWREPARGLVYGSGHAYEDSSLPRVEMKPSRVLSKFDINIGSPGSDGFLPLDLIRRSDRRLVERIWVDPRTGLVYRRELFGSRGHTIGLTTMLEMEIGDGGNLEPLEPRNRARKVKQVTKPKAPETLPYNYELAGTYEISAGKRPSTHWVYSDGLHTLSVFRTKGVLDKPDGYHKAELDDGQAWVGPGPGTWTWQGGPNVWVIVAEEPQLDPEVLTSDLPTAGRSAPAKLGSWWSRALHWVGDRL